MFYAWCSSPENQMPVVFAKIDCAAEGQRVGSLKTAGRGPQAPGCACGLACAPHCRGLCTGDTRRAGTRALGGRLCDGETLGRNVDLPK